MRLKIHNPRTTYQGSQLIGALFLTLLCLAGCRASEKDEAPVVNVEVTPARRAPISEKISAEALVFPLRQAIITPKITSTIKTFLVQRGSRGQKGQGVALGANDHPAASDTARQ